MQSSPLDAGAAPVARAPSPSTPRKTLDAVDVFTAPWRRHEAWAALGSEAPARVGTAGPSPGPSRASSPGVDDAFTLLDGASGWTTATSRSPSPSPSPSPGGGGLRARRALDRPSSVEAVLAHRGSTRSPSVGDDDDATLCGSGDEMLDGAVGDDDDATLYGSGDEMLDGADDVGGEAAGSGASTSGSASDAAVEGGPAARPADPVAAAAPALRRNLPAQVVTGLAVGVSLALVYRAAASPARNLEAVACGRRRAADAVAHLWAQASREGAGDGLWPRLRIAAAGLSREASRAYASLPGVGTAYAGVRHRLEPAQGAVVQGTACLRAGLEQAARRLADAAARG